MQPAVGRIFLTTYCALAAPSLMPTMHSGHNRQKSTDIRLTAAEMTRLPAPGAVMHTRCGPGEGVAQCAGGNNWMR
jgi:hypothetical protein